MRFRRKEVEAAIALTAGPVGFMVGKLHLIRPSPGIFFSLGVIATLCVIGIAFGFREARRVTRVDRGDRW